MKDDHIGTADKPREDYDLIKVTMIRRGNNKKITEPKFKYLKSMYEADIDEILFQLFISETRRNANGFHGNKLLYDHS